jgi:RNA polymerase sigma-70 factor (ECF subfamily)
MLDERFDEVLAGARVGDEGAWTLLHDELARPMLGWLRGRGVPEPEDVLGEVFLAIARDLGRFEGDEAGFRSWAFTIAHRRGVDAVRHRRRRPVAPVADERLVPLAEALRGTPDELEAAVARIDDTALLTQLLDHLTDEQRDVVVLRFAADLDTATVGRLTGRSPNAVAAVTTRALARLRAVVEAGGALSGAASAGPSPEDGDRR